MQAVIAVICTPRRTQQCACSRMFANHEVHFVQLNPLSPARLATHIGVNVGHLSDLAALDMILCRPTIHERSKYCALHRALTSSRTSNLACGLETASQGWGRNHAASASSVPSRRWRLRCSRPSRKSSIAKPASADTGESTI